MKGFITVFILALTTLTSPTLSNDNIKINKNYKIEGTFSGNTSNENSFHLIIAKKKDDKTYDVIPYLYKEGKTSRLDAINYKVMPSIVSFHNNGLTLSLITRKKNKSKDEFFNIIDIDLESGQHDIGEEISAKNFSALVRRDNKNILIFSKDTSLDVLEVSSSKEIKSITVESNDTSLDFFKALNKGKLNAVNNNDFVANGSISKFRVYGEDDKLILTKEGYKKDNTEVVTIPLTGEKKVQVGAKLFSNGEGDFKKSTSYVSGDKLIQLKANRKDMNLKIHSMTEGNSKSLSLNDIKMAKTANGFKDTSSFLKQISKRVHTPTITINRTKNKNLRVRVGYVNNTIYNYYYDWWWHHQMQWNFHQQMMQQQMLNNIPQSVPRFGPNGSEYQNVYSPLSHSNSYFEFVIDSSNNFANDDQTETIHKEIDTKKYVDKLDNNSKLKHVSTVFTKEKFRYISYNKKTKGFSIKEEKIYD